MPVLVFFLLERLNPVVGNAHCHAVVEADAAVAERKRQTRHAAHLLGDSNCRGLNLVYEYICEGKICEGVGILTAVVVVGIRTEGLAEAVIIVKHRCDTIEAEAVEVIFLEPVFAVGEQEMEHFILAVVETQRIPCRMLAARTVGVEIQIVASVEQAYALVFVLHGMTVNDIHYHRYTLAVGLVDKFFQVVGRTETARGGKEIGHMIAKRTVIGMLLNGHNLNGVVAVGNYSRKHLGAEFVVRTHAFCLLCHAYMTLIYEQWRCIGHEVGITPLKCCSGRPHSCRENVCVGVLHHMCGIGRYALAMPSGPLHEHLVKLSVFDCIGRQLHLPDTGHTPFYRVECELRQLFPVRKVANQAYRACIRSPFAKYPPTTHAV